MGYNAPKQTVSQFQLKGRYARQYLSFAGKSSKDFLLYLSGPGVYDSPAAVVESTSVPGRNGDHPHRECKGRPPQVSERGYQV